MNIVLFYEDNSLFARVYNQDWLLRHTIAPYDISGIPKEIVHQPQYIQKFLQNTCHRLIPLSDGSFRLAIQHRLLGGGKGLLYFVSGALITVGVLAISATTGGIGTVILSGTFIGAGVEGGSYTYKTDDAQLTTKEYIKHTVSGAASGALSSAGGAAGVAYKGAGLAGAMAIGGIGSGSGRLAKAGILDEKFDKKLVKEVLVAAGIGALATGIAHKIANSDVKNISTNHEPKVESLPSSSEPHVIAPQATVAESVPQKIIKVEAVESLSSLSEATKETAEKLTLFSKKGVAELAAKLKNEKGGVAFLTGLGGAIKGAEKISENTTEGKPKTNDLVKAVLMGSAETLAAGIIGSVAGCDKNKSFGDTVKSCGKGISMSTGAIGLGLGITEAIRRETENRGQRILVNQQADGQNYISEIANLTAQNQQAEEQLANEKITNENLINERNDLANQTMRLQEQLANHIRAQDQQAPERNPQELFGNKNANNEGNEASNNSPFSS